MNTDRDRRTHGPREVLLGTLLSTFLLVVILATFSLPELGMWVYR